MVDDFHQFSNYLAERGYSRRTIQGYLADLQQMKNWSEKQAALSSETTEEMPLNPQVLQAYFQSLQQNAVSPGTRNRQIAAVRAFEKYKNQGQVFDQTHSGITREKFHPQPIPEATHKDLRALIKEFHREQSASRTERQTWHAVRNWAILHVLRETGLRASKICALCLESDATSYEVGVLREIFPGVELSTSARQALMDWLDIRTPGPGVLFTSYSGKPLQPCDLYRLLQTLGSRANVHITPEMLR